MNIQNFWKSRKIVNYALLPLSFVWFIISTIRQNIRQTYKSKLFVICVGNINVGGTGKTPTAISVAKSLSTKGYKIAFLTKGYKGSISDPTWVNLSQHSYKETGDEPLILAQYMPTLISKSFLGGLQVIEKDTSFDMVICDDGYQNESIHKDFNLLVINGDYLFGNNFLLPAGPLRETINHGFKKADNILLLENDNQEIITLGKKYNIPVFFGYYSITNLKEIPKKVFAFCGIGLPEKFIRMLTKNNISAEQYKFFPDHHSYDEYDLDNLNVLSQKLQLPLVTTEKDYLKIKDHHKYSIKKLSIENIIENEENLTQNIIKKFEDSKITVVVKKTIKLKWLLKDTMKTLAEIILAILAYFIFYSFKYLVPIKISSKIGYIVGKYLIANIPIRRKYEAIKNISFAFPKKSQDEVLEIYQESCANFGQVIFEIPKVAAINRNKDLYKVVDNYGALEIMAKGKCLLFCAHIGNWELSGLSLIDAKIDNKSINVIYKDPNNEYVKNLFANLRKDSGTNTITLNKRTILELNKKIKKPPASIYMLIDQRIKEGIQSKLFNRPALTSTLLPMFAVKYDIPLIPLRVIRNKDNTFTIRYEKALQYTKTGDNKKDIENVTQLMNNELQRWIEEYPQQWFWLHRRW